MKKALKWIGIGIGSLIGLALVAGAVVALIGRSRVNRTYTTAVPLLKDTTPDSGAVERGRHLVAVHGCQGCHGEKLDGTVALDIPLARATASNLTSGAGGVAASYKAAGDWDRAIRHGIRPNGKFIIPMMPYFSFNRISDADLSDLIAFLRSLPPTDHVLPPSKVRIPGYILIGFAGDSILRGGLGAPPHVSPPKGTAEYGGYLVSNTCAECHGPKLLGGKPPDPDSPPAPGLTMYIGKPDQFRNALRTGTSLSGRTLTDFMPWKAFRNYTDEEISSLYLYLTTSNNPHIAAGGQHVDPHR